MYEINNVYNEDCYKAIKQIPDKSVDLIYIDIPYELSYSGGGCLDSNVKNKIEIMKKHQDNLIKGIDYSILKDFVRIMKKTYIYIWCSKAQIYDLMNYFVGELKCNYEILVWIKDNPVPFGNKQFLSDIEYCVVFYEKGVKVNIGCENKHKWYLSHINTQDKDLYEHPTIKPLEFVKKHILNSTNEGDLVLDCFCGSGTTLVACKELNRNYLGFEIDKEYYEISKNRLKGISQKEVKEKEKGIQNIFDYIGEE